MGWRWSAEDARVSGALGVRGYVIPGAEGPGGRHVPSRLFQKEEKRETSEGFKQAINATLFICFNFLSKM